MPKSGVYIANIGILNTKKEGFIETRQAYNLFQDLWNRFIILEGG